MAEIFNRCVVDVAGITGFMAYQWHQNLRKSLHALEPVAIMRVATRFPLASCTNWRGKKGVECKAGQRT
jgi:hypothetical protein